MFHPWFRADLLLQASETPHRREMSRLNAAQATISGIRATESWLIRLVALLVGKALATTRAIDRVWRGNTVSYDANRVNLLS